MWSESDGEVHEDRMARSSGGSEVVMIDERALASASNPYVGSLNVTKSSRVQIGPRFVSVTQNVHNNEVIKGRILGLELMSPKNRHKFRCSLVVFVCWAFIAVVGLAFYLLQKSLNKEPTRLDIDLHAEWYLRRHEWQAMDAYRIMSLDIPVSYVIVGHSAGQSCERKFKCIESVLNIQKGHLGRQWDDIGPNFLVGGDGYVFEGRGANVFPAMVKSWNRRSITIMFVGDYTVEQPVQSQFDHLNMLLEQLVHERVLTPEYVVYGHCQVAGQIVTPGPNIMDNLSNVSHWNSANKTLYLPLHKYLWNVTKNTTRNERLWCSAATVALLICIALIVCLTLPKAQETQILDVAPHDWNITREMWLAQIYEYNQTMDEFNPLRLVIIQHTVSPECDRFIFCAAELRSLQSYYLNVLEYDIPYTFLIGNDGRVYEGRGWNKVGAHTYGYNRCSIGIGFIGDYREEVPSHATVTDRQIENTKMLLETGVKLGYLHPDYYIVGAKDLKNSESPGSNLYNAIKNLSHYDHETRYRDMTCEQIHDLYT